MTQPVTGSPCHPVIAPRHCRASATFRLVAASDAVATITGAQSSTFVAIQRSTLSLPSRAREARRFLGALRQSDLLEPPGRRCGCWRRRHFFFAELLLGRFRFGADDGAVAIDAYVGFAGSGRWRWCRRRSS